MTEEKAPPDGGIRACTVLFASFLCNGLIFAFINSYSIIYTLFFDIFTENGVSNAATIASLIGSLMMGTTFLLSMVSGIVSDRLGIRPTTFIGGAILTSSLLISSYIVDQATLLIFTLGVMYGIGASLAYVPSLTIVGHYFKKYIGIANGFVTLGSSVFTMILPFYLEFLITTVKSEKKTVQLANCLRYQAALLSILMLCSLAFKPRYSAPPLSNEKSSQTARETDKKAYLANFINLSIWKNKKYIVWIIAVPVALCGYLVPYVHMAKYIQDRFPENDPKLPIVCSAITSGIGRIIFGRLSDHKKVDSILLQQLSFFMIGVTSILIPLTNSYTLLLVLNLILGLFDGCFISVIGPIAFRFCGPKGAGQAIGFLLGLNSGPMTIGPAVAGWIYDKRQSYTLPFVLAGIPPFIGAAILTKIHFMKSSDDDDNDNHHSNVEFADGTTILGGGGSGEKKQLTINEGVEEYAQNNV